MQLTRHAKIRAAQRTVPLSVVHAVYDYGVAYASRGVTGLRLDRRALDLATDDLSPREVERLRRFASTILIADGAHVITVIRAPRSRFH
jgi:hypothetical protein